MDLGRPVAVHDVRRPQERVLTELEYVETVDTTDASGPATAAAGGDERRRVTS